MTEQDGNVVQEELERLREEIATLRAERDATAAADRSQTAAGDEAEPAADETSDRYTAANLTEELRDLIEVIDKELKDTNPVTLLVVFALGAFVGRMLPR